MHFSLIFRRPGDQLAKEALGGDGEGDGENRGSGGYIA